MYRIVFLIMLFLVVFYIISFLRIRRNKRKREAQSSFVEQYNRERSRKREAARRRSDQFYSKGGNIQNYVTKYNSPVDYVEKGSDVN